MSYYLKWCFHLSKQIKMTKEERDNLKVLIEAEIIKTKVSLVNYEEMTKPIAPENSIGRISRIDAINNKSVIEAAMRTEKRKLKNLNIALTRVYDNEFGKCAKCKRTIQEKRLMLMPQSRFCVRCAS